LAIQALAGGDPPLMSIGQVVQAGLAGFDLALIAGVETYYDSTVFARPEITRLEQLKGKRLGISGYGAATHFAAIILAQHLKLDPDKDIMLVPGGPDAERVAAMSAGKIDAAIFNSSTIPIAKRMGLVELVKIPDLKVEVQGNGMATTRSYIKTNRDVVKSALKGYIEGIHLIFSNKATAQKVFARYMRTNDLDVLESSYQAYITTTPKKPYPTLKGLQFLLDRLAPQMPQAKTAKPEQFVDMSFLQELEKEGFFNEMAKRYPAK
jgi:NitT/TauT family transport system substrate-binding protein